MHQSKNIISNTENRSDFVKPYSPIDIKTHTRSRLFWIPFTCLSKNIFYCTIINKQFSSLIFVIKFPRQISNSQNKFFGGVKFSFLNWIAGLSCFLEIDRPLIKQFRLVYKECQWVAHDWWKLRGLVNVIIPLTVKISED